MPRHPPNALISLDRSHCQWSSLFVCADALSKKSCNFLGTCAGHAATSSPHEPQKTGLPFTIRSIMTKAPATRGVTIPTSWFEAPCPSTCSRHGRMMKDTPVPFASHVIKTSFSEISIQGRAVRQRPSHGNRQNGQQPATPAPIIDMEGSYHAGYVIQKVFDFLATRRRNPPSRCNLLFTILTEQAPGQNARGANLVFPG